MLPVGFYESADSINDDFGAEFSDKTYDLSNMNRFIEGKEAVRQAVIKILSTERFFCPVYSTDYGFEFHDLIGLDCDYVCVMLEQRITDALVADERITEVSDFDFSIKKNVIFASFIVHSIYGEFDSRKEFVYE
jgi:hypothetical protein